MKKITLLVSILIVNCVLPIGNCFSQNTWIQKSNFTGAERQGAVSFSIGTKGYVGAGWQWNTYLNDFWEWNQSTNVWTQKANLPAKGRRGATGFSIGTKGYIGTGETNYTQSGYELANDFWEWDQMTNTWIQKSDFLGTPRSGAIGFSIGTKGYIGTGKHMDDFWEWDQLTDTWSQKADFAGGGRDVAVGFSIGTKGYIGTGDGNITYNGTTCMQDFWEWDQTSDTWTRKADFIGARAGAVGFSMNSKGYLGLGMNSTYVDMQDFLEWDPSTNVWIQRANFGGKPREVAIGFSIGMKGYIGVGMNDSNFVVTYQSDFWEYAPATGGTAVINVVENNATLEVFPNPASNAVTINFSASAKGKLTLNITNELGAAVYSENKKDFTGDYVNTIDLSSQPKGVYFVEMVLGSERRTKKIILE
jgi:N-acetylneuraminic acid mutarotase